MKSVTGNPALDAYQRMAMSGVSPARPAAQGDPSPAETSGAKEAAHVEISEAARELARAGEAVDQRKVDDLKSRVAAGTFEVDSAAVARRMLDTLG